jgi:hypothetical protein
VITLPSTVVICHAWMFCGLKAEIILWKAHTVYRLLETRTLLWVQQRPTLSLPWTFVFSAHGMSVWHVVYQQLVSVARIQQLTACSLNWNAMS